MKITSDILRGHTDTIILSLLIDEDMYGYQITKKILEMSDGELELKEGTLYSSFKRLQKSNYITAYWGDENAGARRKYYKLTEEGLEFYKLKYEEWINSIKIIGLFMKEVR